MIVHNGQSGIIMFHDIVDNNADKVTIIKMAGDSIIIITTMLINNGYDMIWWIKAHEG